MARLSNASLSNILRRCWRGVGGGVDRGVK